MPHDHRDVNPAKSKQGSGSRLVLRLVLVVGSLVASLVLVEVGLRVFVGGALFVDGRDREGWTENTETFNAFMRVDPVLGYVPLPDTLLYDERGLCRDDEKLDGALQRGDLRVLWVGDSVTARRFIEREVRRQLQQAGRPAIDSLCGGVEGYNAAQTAGYAQQLLALEPDHVVFTLHHNDWWNTPIVFYDDEGRVHCRDDVDHEVGSFSPWWFEHSYVYRMLFSLSVSSSTADQGERADAKVERAIASLRDALEVKGVAFTVLFLPPMLPRSAWDGGHPELHRRGNEMLARLGVDHIDLLPGLEAALSAGVEVQQQPEKNDWMHPSEACAAHLARVALSAGLFRR